VGIRSLGALCVQHAAASARPQGGDAASDTSSLVAHKG
jgi:hypothetical protein